MSLKKAEITAIKKNFLAGGAIDNPSSTEAKMARWTRKMFTSLQPEVATIDPTNNFFARFSGDKKLAPIFLCAHLDAVDPCHDKQPHFDGRTFRSNGRTVLGADDLVGIVVILATIAHLQKNKIPHPPLEILLTAMEESGGRGLQQFDLQQMKAQIGLVLDSAAAVGRIVQESPTKYNFSIFVRDGSSRARPADRGVTTTKILAELLIALPQGRIREKVFLNISRLTGNITAGEARVDGRLKIYAAGNASVENNLARSGIGRISRIIHRIAKKYPRSRIYCEHKLVRHSYRFRSTDPLIQRTQTAIRAAGQQPKLVKSFGLGDANTLNWLGRRAVMIGTSVKNPHTVRETVELVEIVKLVEIVVEFCRAKIKK